MSGLRLVFFSEWVENYTSFVLWYLYDTSQLWYVLDRVHELARDIYLSFILGSDVNHRELLDLLDVFDSTDWSKVPVTISRRCIRRDYHSPSRASGSGFFVWYDPYTRAVTDSVTSRDSSRLRLQFGDDFPTCFMFVDDTVVSQLIYGSSVIVPASDVVYTVMASVTLMIFPPSDPTFIVFRAFLAQDGVAVEVITCMVDAVAKFSSMLKVASFVPDVMAFGEIETFETKVIPAVPYLGSTAEVALRKVVNPTPGTVSGVDVDLDDTDWVT